jgi:hypothetical protein
MHDGMHLHARDLFCDRGGEFSPRPSKVGVVVRKRASADLEYLLEQRARIHQVAEGVDRDGEAASRLLQIGVVVRERARPNLEDLFLQRARAL